MAGTVLEKAKEGRISRSAPTFNPSHPPSQGGRVGQEVLLSPFHFHTSLPPTSTPLSLPLPHLSSTPHSYLLESPLRASAVSPDRPLPLLVAGSGELDVMPILAKDEVVAAVGSSPDRFLGTKETWRSFFFCRWWVTVRVIDYY